MTAAHLTKMAHRSTSLSNQPIMTIDNAHPDDIKAFDQFFWKNPEVIKIMHRIEQYQQTHKYVQCMQEKQKLDQIRRKSFENFIRDYEVKVRTIDLKDIEMPNVEKATINELYITIYMACDIIESGVLDINDALHRVDKNLEIVQFDELKELAKEVKKKLNYLQRTENYMNMNTWGDKCDNMYQMMRNKAKAIIKKKLEEDKKPK